MNNVVQTFLKIRIHPLFWFTILIGILTANFLEIMLLFGIVLIHELGHALMASYYGWRINKIELLPFGGVADVDEYGNRLLKEEVMVLIAGPVQHIWMLLLCKYLFVLGILGEETYYFLLYNNLSILFFNLLPIFPLDGGKLLFTFLSLSLPFKKAHKVMIISSTFFLLLFIIVILVISPMNISIWCMVVFLFFSIWREWRQEKYIFMRFLIGRYHHQQLLQSRRISVLKEDKLFAIFSLFQRGCRYEIMVEDRKIDEILLLHAYFHDKKLMIDELIS